jgi:succinate dehydrogenase / fumarate reductase, membrane anchor subunit
LRRWAISDAAGRRELHKMSDHRTALGRVRGLGSAKEGVAHWWMQRVTALLLIPLVIWFVAALLAHMGADYAGVIAWLRQPLTYGLMVVLLGAVFWHATLCLQVVIEDYVRGEAAKLALILLTKGACLGLFMAGFVSLSKIAFVG